MQVKTQNGEYKEVTIMMYKSYMINIDCSKGFSINFQGNELTFATLPDVKSFIDMVSN